MYLERESRLTCGGQETAKQLKLGIEIVHGRFKEIGDSYSKRLLLQTVTSVATEQRVSWLAN